MHPAAFRKEFGRDMLLDFEDSVAHHGVVRICLDGLLSMARQWGRCAVSGGADRTCEVQPSMLAGQYAPVRDQPLNPLELSRGLFASLVLLGVCGYGLGHGTRTQPLNIVYAASQGARMFQGEAAGQTNGSSSVGGSTGRRFEQFDVISIRENKSSGPPHMSFPMTNDDSYVPTHGYMQISDLPLFAYIQFAYRMNAIQAVDLRKQLPDWALSTRYDIEARVEGDPDKDDMRLMVRALLASRFHLQLRPDTRVASVYDLTLAHPGKTGPSLHPDTTDEASCSNQAPSGSFSPCGAIRFSSGDSNTGPVIRMTGRRISLDLFATYAATEVALPVQNKTGLIGRYDFTLEFAPSRVGDVSVTEQPEPLGTPFQDAIQRQLGLKPTCSIGSSGLVRTKTEAFHAAEIVYVLTVLDSRI